MNLKMLTFLLLKKWEKMPFLSKKSIKNNKKCKKGAKKMGLPF
jgi:hypothetical protein